jgi:hypothetical protein
MDAQAKRTIRALSHAGLLSYFKDMPDPRSVTKRPPAKAGGFEEQLKVDLLG